MIPPRLLLGPTAISFTGTRPVSEVSPLPHSTRASIAPSPYPITKTNSISQILAHQNKIPAQHSLHPP
ncbi:hypothetical protein EJ06DRAFT_529805 [Trichodelitschia bisporula]|uniref:Uncharacterized protein n=1 Tax=Trichodelitschia bisporula TaxID=703511 RepID=A0A6G1HXZ6_9PEZI|nr:hypothetical protein EJ06DRAFT_529805 [Trichodelitschia bisporula]